MVRIFFLAELLKKLGPLTIRAGKNLINRTFLGQGSSENVPGSHLVETFFLCNRSSPLAHISQGPSVVERKLYPAKSSSKTGSSLGHWFHLHAFPPELAVIFCERSKSKISPAVASCPGMHQPRPFSELDPEPSILKGRLPASALKLGVSFGEHSPWEKQRRLHVSNIEELEFELGGSDRPAVCSRYSLPTVPIGAKSAHIRWKRNISALQLDERMNAF